MKFSEILEHYGIPYKTAGEHRHSTEGWLSLECPYCSPKSGKFKLGYNLAHAYASCWQCGSVRIVDALVTITGDSPGNVWRMFRTVPAEKWKDLPDRRGKLELPRGLGPLLPAHRKYLRGRGFDPDELVRLWGLQGIGIAADLAWRVFIPVISRGEVVSWTTRTIGENGKRYLNARPEQEKISQKKVLFGADYVRHAAIIVEGPLDAMKIGPGAVATMGLITTVAQQLWIAGIPKRIICFDNEPAAQARARQLINAINVFPGETFNAVPDGKDTGEATPREIRQLRKMLD